MPSVVTGVEMFHKVVDQGMAGDNAGLAATAASSAPTWSADGGGQTESINPHRSS